MSAPTDTTTTTMPSSKHPSGEDEWVVLDDRDKEQQQQQQPAAPAPPKQQDDDAAITTTDDDEGHAILARRHDEVASQDSSSTANGGSPSSHSTISSHQSPESFNQQQQPKTKKTTTALSPIATSGSAAPSQKRDGGELCDVDEAILRSLTVIPCSVVMYGLVLSCILPPLLRIASCAVAATLLCSLHPKAREKILLAGNKLSTAVRSRVPAVLTNTVIPASKRALLRFVSWTAGDVNRPLFVIIAIDIIAWLVLGASGLASVITTILLVACVRRQLNQKSSSAAR